MFMEKFFTYTTVDPLAVTLPEAAVWSRLGRNRFLSHIDPAMEVKLKLAMLRAEAMCRPCGRWCLLPVTCEAEAVIRLGGDWQIVSPAFAEFAAGADFLWLGAVTVGDKVSGLVNAVPDDLASSVVYDAVGSECADQALENLQLLASQTLRRYDLELSCRRFSIGYGAVELKHQQRVFDWLKLEDLGMSLTGSFIMQPEKSVTAFARVNKINDQNMENHL